MSRVRLAGFCVVILATFAPGGPFVVRVFPSSAIADVVVLPPAPAGPPLLQPLPTPAPAPPRQTQSAPADGSSLQEPKAPSPAEFERTIAELEARAAREPDNAEVRHTLATQYWNQAYNGPDLSPADRAALLERGLMHTERALLLKPEYLEAVVAKSLLLRSKAQLEPGADVKQALIAEADKLRDRAVALRDARNAWNAVPPNALRVGSATPFPKKTKHVAPVYPPDAQEAGISGVVTVETVIGVDGKVRDVRVRRSVPRLDVAAMNAVRQWEFTPTLLNGEAVPVVAAMAVEFVGDEKKTGKAGAAPPVPPPPPLAPPPPGHEPLDPSAVRIGDGSTSPTKLVDVRPVYPPSAKEAKIQGAVVLEALIGTDGKVERAVVRRSVRELDQSAVDAVRQWVFAPTLINGQPAKVIVTATVNFSLQ